MSVPFGSGIGPQESADLNSQNNSMMSA